MIIVKNQKEFEKAILTGEVIEVVGNGDFITYGTSTPTINTTDTSAPTIYTYDTSAPTIYTYGTSATTIIKENL